MQRRNVKASSAVKTETTPPVVLSSVEGKRQGGSKLGVVGLIAIALLLVISGFCLASRIPAPAKTVSASLRNAVEGKITEGDDDNYHVVFSTSCSDFQNWQSYVLFYHALRVQQPGHVTRIVSGCSDGEAAALKEFHETSIKTMSPNFHLHVSPDFNALGADMSANFQVTKYFNKPYGMLHWMEEGLGYNEQNMYEAEGETVIALIDPDMLLLRPITRDFRNDSSMAWIKTIPGKPLRVDHGTPMASTYGYGSQPFVKLDLHKIFPEDSPVHKVPKTDAVDFYPAGPPYIATARDMYSITKTWTTVSPKVHDQYPQMLAEMFSYSLAAAHLSLPHTLARTFMVSDPDIEQKEGWSMIDRVDAEAVCDWNPENSSPLVLHYCQRALVERWVMTKYRLRKDFLSCESPLLAEPPMDIATKYNYGIQPPKKKGEPEGGKIPYTPKRTKRHAFMLCRIILQFNKAAEYYKKHNCDAATANFEKTYSTFTDPW